MMSASTQHNACNVLHWMAVRDCAAVVPATSVHPQRLASERAASYDSAQRKRLCTIALAVLGLHAFLAFEMRRAVDSTGAAPRIEVLDIEFSAPRATAPTPAPRVPAPGARPHLYATQPSAAPDWSRLSRTKLAPAIREVPRLPPAIQPAHTAPTARPSSATAPLAAPAPAVYANEAGPAPAEPAAPPSRNVEATPQAVTEPSFGAAYLHNPAPPYPAIAQQRGWQGTVLLKVHVLASGRPDRVSVASSSGHDALDDAASEAVAGWSFVPARRGEQTIDGWVQVPIDFKLGT